MQISGYIRLLAQFLLLGNSLWLYSIIHIFYRIHAIFQATKMIHQQFTSLLAENQMKLVVPFVSRGVATLHSFFQNLPQ